MFVLGNFNVKVGTIKTDKIFGPFGLSDKNERGEALAIWCRCNNGHNEYFVQKSLKKIVHG